MGGRNTHTLCQTDSNFPIETQTMPSRRAATPPSFALLRTTIIVAMLAFVGGVGVFFVLIGWHGLSATILPSPPQQPAKTSTPLGTHPLPAPLSPAPRRSPPQKKASLASDMSPRHHLQAGDAAQPPMKWESARLRLNHMFLASNAATALRHGRQGAVRLRATIDRAATGHEGSVFNASGSHQFVDAAREAVERWRLKPARYLNRAMESPAIILFLFSP